MHPHHYYGQYYRRGPSRLWWFFLGGAAVTLWSYMRKPEEERRRFMWRREHCVKGRSDEHRLENDASFRQNATQASASPGFSKDADAFKREDNWNGEPLWKLRSEKEAERRQIENDFQVREELLKTREKVLSATESGLESLRRSLESLTKMVQEQRRDQPTHDQSAQTVDSSKKDQ